MATAAFQIAKALGARVIVTSSSDAKLDQAAALGADATVNHATGDVKQAVLEATDRTGVDIVVEHVGEATWRTSLDVARQRGRIVVCGATGRQGGAVARHRQPPPLDPRQATAHGARMEGDFHRAPHQAPHGPSATLRLSHP